jgi:hypothetical protein
MRPLEQSPIPSDAQRPAAQAVHGRGCGQGDLQRPHRLIDDEIARPVPPASLAPAVERPC